jgi:hypothetical protein
MITAGRMLVLAVVGLTLVSGCGSDGGGASTGPQSRSVTTSSAATGTTSSSEQPGADPVTVTHYDADFTVHPSGDLSVVETLALDVPVDDRHGIYRTFDSDIAVESFTATLDGSPTPVTDTTAHDERKFRIGDPQQTLDVGEHAVRMEYEVADVVARDGKGGERFDWLLIPDQWSMEILASDLRVALPSAAAEARCTIDDAQPCEVSGIGTRTLAIVTGKLADHTEVRLQAFMPGP